jgi:rRNA maturation RNase YbeY
MDIKISVSFVPAAKIRQLNKDLRGKDYTPAVLSFPYFEKLESEMILGEILISRSEARKLAKREKNTEKEQIEALVLHGVKELFSSGELGDLC